MKMKKKGFTLVELLVVIAIIALLMSILMPALARVRTLAFRMVCGSNLAGIGKAMLIYANDYEDSLPRAGGKSSVYGYPIPHWESDNRYTAFNINKSTLTGGTYTITSCFYLTIKYADMTPKSFLCKGETFAKEFKISEHLFPTIELINAWDFGDAVSGTDSPRLHCSYSYHYPFGTWALTTATSDPGVAIAADSNPWIAPPGGTAEIWANFLPTGTLGGTQEQEKAGNSVAHGKEGQNVLFLDGHVSFSDCKTPCCGVNNDNIYTGWSSTTERKRGIQPPASGTPGGVPLDRLDSLLVNDRIPW